MIRVLFVCLGNICRSPMAEGIFKQKIIDRGLNNQFKSDSAGTSQWHLGEPPDPRTLKTLKNHGIHLSHLGRQVTTQDAEDFDYILAMDSSNYRDLRSILPSNFEGLHLMRHFDPVAKNTDVPDPYYDGLDGFENVFTILDRSVNGFLDYVNSGNG